MKKYSLNLLLSLILLTGLFVLTNINSAKAESRGDMEFLVKQSIMLWNTGNTAIADQIFAADFKLHLVDQETPVIQGTTELMDLISWFMKAYPDMKIVVDHINVDGDTVIARVTYTGTNTGPRGDMPPTNKKVKVSTVWIYQIKEGVITEEWNYVNKASIFNQLGFTLVPSSEEK